MSCCPDAAGGCACVVTEAPDDGCSPVTINVSGAGSSAVPYTVGGTLDLTRVVTLDGHEPWATTTVGGCEVLTSRCTYGTSSLLKMCDATNDLVGYFYFLIDCETGAASQKYVALGGTVTSAIPSGWQVCCPAEGASEFFPMCTPAASADDPDDLVGYMYLQVNEVTGAITQQYITLAGAVTSTIPANWQQCGCGASDSGGAASGGISVVVDSVHVYLSSGNVVNDKKYPDWGQPGLAVADRRDGINAPPGYPNGTWKKLVVTVRNVQAALTADLTIRLLDVTNTVTVGTVTFASGSSPTGSKLRGTATLSGSVNDDTDITWHVVTAEAAAGTFGLHGQAFIEWAV